MKAVVAAFNQEKALVGAFSVITNLRMDLFRALVTAASHVSHLSASHNVVILVSALLGGGGGGVSSSELMSFS